MPVLRYNLFSFAAAKKRLSSTHHRLLVIATLASTSTATSVTDTSIRSLDTGAATATTMTTGAAAAAAAAATKKDDVCSFLEPQVKQPYRVLSNEQVSPDSHVIEFDLPSGREILGWDKNIPTCISVSYNQGTADEEEEDGTSAAAVLSKSYSPITHPNQVHTFSLLVKAYPPRPGGGVGSYLCHLQPGDAIQAKVKKPRIVHGSSEILRRWNHVGLVAGGTGIAPLYQLLQLLIQDDDDNDDRKTKIYVLSINRTERDILLKEELDQLARQYPDRVRVTYSLTGEHDNDAVDNSDNNNVQPSASSSSSTTRYLSGRGSLDMIRVALPHPTEDDDGGSGGRGIMVFVCGKDGFVETWGGPVIRAPPAPDGTKGPKIQGPLLGLLRDAGYDASQVFKY